MGEEALRGLKLGLQGVPFFVVNDVPAFSGAQTPQTFLEVFQQALGKDEPFNPQAVRAPDQCFHFFFGGGAGGQMEVTVVVPNSEAPGGLRSARQTHAAQQLPCAAGGQRIQKRSTMEFREAALVCVLHLAANIEI